MPFGEHNGVSRPPRRWHTNPGLPLEPGLRVWFVLAARWPVFGVATSLCLQPPEHELIWLKDIHFMVPLSRIFLSRQDAESEARVLHEFALVNIDLEARPTVGPRGYGRRPAAPKLAKLI
jgi:hypothetical protein